MTPSRDGRAQARVELRSTTIRVSTRRHSFQVVRHPSAGYPAGAPVGCPRDAVVIARHAIGSEITECLLAIFLDARHRVTGYAEVARGTLNATRFTPRDLLVPALQVGCAALVVAHNHPSGALDPSRADRQVTVALRDACALVGTPLLDHLIVTDTGYHSFRESEGWESPAAGMWAASPAQENASSPVRARPMARVCTSSLPS